MMGKKKLSEIKAQLKSANPAGKTPLAITDPNRIVETLESLCAALESEVKKNREPITRRRPSN